MSIERVKQGEDPEIASRRFKRKCEKDGILTEARRREYYEKPTSERKRKLAAAIKRDHKRKFREVPGFVKAKKKTKHH